MCCSKESGMSQIWLWMDLNQKVGTVASATHHFSIYEAKRYSQKSASP